MLGLLKDKDAVVDNAAKAVQDRPKVQAVKAELMQARAAQTEALNALNGLEQTVAPETTSASSAVCVRDEIAVIRARAALPQARQVYWEADIVLKNTERQAQTVLEADTQLLDQARVAARRGLMQELFKRLDVAKEIAEEIRVYDEQTTRLGGRAPSHPFIELLDESNRTGSVTFRRQMFTKDGWL